MCRPLAQLRPLALQSNQGQPSTSSAGRGAPPTQRCFATRKRVDSCAVRGVAMYQQALEKARDEDWFAARAAFEELVAACPYFSKGWVSYAQMEKRICKRAGESGIQRFNRCREVLQRAMTLNPSSPELTQAWGLMELQKGNVVAAVKLLERSAQQDPRNLPVLRWKPVREARITLQSTRIPARREP